MVDLRVLIVDDEPPALRRMQTLLKSLPEIDVVGECSNGLDAVDSIRRLAPDVVFLDIQMPELDGFGVVERVAHEPMPVIVFVTAHDEHAIKAFEVHALDYLLKPIDRARFAETVDRARIDVALRQRRSGVTNERIVEMLARMSGETRWVERLAIKAHGKITFVCVDQIVWIEAVGKYVRVHAGRTSALLREPMHSLEARLDPRQFVRIHRSSLVNVRSIHDIEPAFRGECRVRLQDGTELTLGRSYREAVCRRLGIHP